MSEHIFNGQTYAITQDADGWYSIVRADGKSLGSAAAFHGAVHAATLDAYPREPRRTLRTRP